jgi:DNA polymerase-3 subunit beta
MKTFKINSKELSSKLTQVVGIINPTNTMPVLENVLFQCIDNSKMLLTASDLESTLTIESKAEFKEAFEFLTPGKILLDIVKTFSDQSLTFEVKDKGVLEISSTNGTYELTHYDSKEFPTMPIIENSSTFEIDSEVLTDSLSKTMNSLAVDELRPTLTGVLVQMFDGQVNFVSTDGNKLVYIQNEVQNSKEGIEFILPKKPASILNQFASTYDEVVTVVYNNTNASFRMNGLELVCRLIDGKYPNYKVVIPPNEKELVIYRKNLIQSIVRIVKFANKTSNQIALRVVMGELHVAAENIEYSNRGVERLDCSWSEKEDFEIGFNGRFLLEILKLIPSTDVLIKLSTEQRAALIYPIENGAPNEKHLSLVMPVLLTKTQK